MYESNTTTATTYFYSHCNKYSLRGELSNVYSESLRRRRGGRSIDLCFVIFLSTLLIGAQHRLQLTPSSDRNSMDPFYSSPNNREKTRNMAYDFSTVDHLKMSDNGKESEPLSPTFKANNLRNVPLTPTFGLSPRSKQHERMEEGVGVDISWDDDQSEFKPNYDASYRASAIQWVRRNKKKSYLVGANEPTPEPTATPTVSPSWSPTVSSAPSNSSKPTTSPSVSSAPSNSTMPTTSPSWSPTYVASLNVTVNATKLIEIEEFEDDDGFETIETEEEEIVEANATETEEEEEQEEIVETIETEEEKTAETDEEEEQKENAETTDEEQDEEIAEAADTEEEEIAETTEEEQEESVETTETEEKEEEEEIDCLRDGEQCYDKRICFKSCCNGQLDEGVGWFECPNGSKFCGDNGILGSILC
eukprot:scaffold383_cov131-Skeletonema_marinoi.AAC.4